MSVKVEIETLLAKYYADIKLLADRVRRDLVIPLCEKHGLKYEFESMGTWVFMQKMEVGEDWPWSDDIVLLEGAHDVLTALQIETSIDCELGDFIDAYTASTYGKIFYTEP